MRAPRNGPSFAIHRTGACLAASAIAIETPATTMIASTSGLGAPASATCGSRDDAHTDARDGEQCALTRQDTPL